MLSEKTFREHKLKSGKYELLGTFKLVQDARKVINTQYKHLKLKDLVRYEMTRFKRRLPPNTFKHRKPRVISPEVYAKMIVKMRAHMVGEKNPNANGLRPKQKELARKNLAKGRATIHKKYLKGKHPSKGKTLGWKRMYDREGNNYYKPPEFIIPEGWTYGIYRKDREMVSKR